MKNENIRVPKLRFKEFSGEWEEKSLESIAKFLKGKGISKSDINKNGDLECIRYGELYTHYKEKITEIYSRTNLEKDELVLSEYGDIIIPASGETQIDIATASCVLKNGVALSGDLNIIKTEEDGLFLSYYLNNARKLDIAKLSQGISVVHLYSSQLKLLKLNLPQKQEQEKIASFLSSIDKKINQLSKKDELLQNYKKAMMQKIFSQKLRFKKADGSDYPKWEEKKLKEIGNIITGSTPSTNIKEYYNGNKLFVSPIDIQENRYISFTKTRLTELGFKKGRKIEKDSVCFVCIGSTIGKVAQVNEDAVTNQQINTISSNKYNSNDFIYSLLFYNAGKIKLLAGEQAVPQINKTDFSNIKFKIPSLEEQTKIANFLSSLDTKISQNKKALEETQKFKKALLQKMFV